MFEESLIESKKTIKTHRGKTTVLSFVIQVAVICVLVLLPLVFTEALPTTALMTTQLTAPPPPPPPPPPAAAAAPKPQPQVSRAIESEMTMPTKIPRKIAMVRDEPMQAAAPPPGAVVGGVPGGVAGGQIGGVLGGVLSSAPAAVPKIATPKKVRVSQGVSEGLLLHKVMPQYPPLARQARIQGKVVLQAVISKDGTIQNLQVVSGHPMLTAAAINAVKQWKYKPYVLNGQPVEVETNITVDFTMSQG